MPGTNGARGSVRNHCGNQPGRLTATTLNERFHVWLPKEHDAYGQVAFPLATAVGVAGGSTGGLLLSNAVIDGFLPPQQ